MVFTSLDNKWKDTAGVATAKPQCPCERKNKDDFPERGQKRR